MVRVFSVLILLLLPGFAVAEEDGPPSPWLAPPGTYVLDPETVAVTMTARRFLMPPIHAEFHTVAGTMTVSATDEDVSTLAIEVEAGDLSANGPIVERMLKGESFLNAEAHPAIAFTAGDFIVSEAPIALDGALAMAGLTAPAGFDTRLEGYEIDPQTEQLRLRFVAEGELDRRDWGMTGYRGVVSRTVRIRIEADFVRSGRVPVTVETD